MRKRIIVLISALLCLSLCPLAASAQAVNPQQKGHPAYLIATYGIQEAISLYESILDSALPDWISVLPDPGSTARPRRSGRETPAPTPTPAPEETYTLDEAKYVISMYVSRLGWDVSIYGPFEDHYRARYGDTPADDLSMGMVDGRVPVHIIREVEAKCDAVIAEPAEGVFPVVPATNP